MQSDVGDLGTPFDAPVFKSFGVVSLTTGGTPAPRAVAFLRAMSPSHAMAGDWTALRRQTAAAAALRPSFATTTVLPPAAMGKSYVWDSNQQQYVEGTGSAGPAPSNGVRFVLYAVDPLTSKPATPLVEVGYADLIDESTSAAAALRVKIVGGATTYADYVISVSGSSIAATFEASGFITDGTHRLDFDDTLSASSNQATVDFQLSLDQPAVTARLQATLNVGNPTSTLGATFTVTRGTETVVLDGTLTITETQSSESLSESFTVKVNGNVFATITASGESGSQATVTYTGPGGRDLTTDERNALDAMLEAPGTLADLADQALAPASELVGASQPSGF
ncbi:MAG TPA: hypothetical protein VFW66_14275 [Gemmatimonadales bacterium]|nr:hypothetical protein [Gemmatimonadales bacterium]